MSKITRAYTFDINTNDEEDGIVEGRPIVYGDKFINEAFEETIAPGALDNTDLRDVRFLVNHNTDMIPLARSRNNNENSTMHLMVDDQGLKIRVKLDVENNSEARNLYSAIKRGDISGMSFMFNVNDEEWEDADPLPKRTIRSIEKVFEVSAVTFPAYEQTEINTRCKAELESYRTTLENVKRDDIELLKLKTKIKIGL